LHISKRENARGTIATSLPGAGTDKQDRDQGQKDQYNNRELENRQATAPYNPGGEVVCHIFGGETHSNKKTPPWNNAIAEDPGHLIVKETRIISRGLRDSLTLIFCESLVKFWFQMDGRLQSLLGSPGERVCSLKPVRQMVSPKEVLANRSQMLASARETRGLESYWAGPNAF
jgi:hypothetical protein